MNDFELSKFVAQELSELETRNVDQLYECMQDVLSDMGIESTESLDDRLYSEIERLVSAEPLLKQIRCYDSGDKFIDRYTVVFMTLPETKPGHFSAVGMSSDPFSPSGFGQHTTAVPGRHLGRRIKFNELPADCQKLILQDLKDISTNNGGIAL